MTSCKDAVKIGDGQRRWINEQRWYPEARNLGQAGVCAYRPHTGSTVLYQVLRDGEGGAAGPAYCRQAAGISPQSKAVNTDS